MKYNFVTFFFGLEIIVDILVKEENILLKKVF